MFQDSTRSLNFHLWEFGYLFVLSSSSKKVPNYLLDVIFADLGLWNCEFFVF